MRHVCRYDRKSHESRPGISRPPQTPHFKVGAVRYRGETYFMYQGIFDTDFDKYTDDAVAFL